MRKRADQIVKGDVLLGGNSNPVRHVSICDGEVYVMFEGGGWETRPAHQTVAELAPRKIAALAIRPGMVVDTRMLMGEGPQRMRVSRVAPHYWQMLVAGYSTASAQQGWWVLPNTHEILLISEPEVEA